VIIIFCSKDRSCYYYHDLYSSWLLLSTPLQAIAVDQSFPGIITAILVRNNVNERTHAIVSVVRYYRFDVIATQMIIVNSYGWNRFLLHVWAADEMSLHIITITYNNIIYYVSCLVCSLRNNLFENIDAVFSVHWPL